MLTHLLISLILVPVIGFFACLFVPRVRERAIFSIVIGVLLIDAIALAVFMGQWIISGAEPVTAHLATLYTSDTYTFSVDLYFDKITAVFLGMTVLMIALVSRFSKFYLHREQGFKRFYVTLLLFLVGLSLIVLAGNFEVLFVGWELIGVSSVLLIAFYRDRYLPARNALKVFSVYRIGDAFLLAALLYAHHVFEQNIRFSDLTSLVAAHGDQMFILGLLLLVVALVKSAQFPFSYWLPRAMEGPTTSSAIFYGALSVHMGVFLLMRTYPLWEGSLGVHLLVAAFGLVTAIVATSIARVQSSAKTQIAYASIAQIGIMFIELAAGLHWLVLIHFVSNAALRAYQLLISPSIVGYLVHDQFFYFVPPVHKIKNTLLGKIRGTFFVLGIKEWNMNGMVRTYIWAPLKSIGRTCAFADAATTQIALLLFAVIVGVVSATVPLSTFAGIVLSVMMATIGGVLYIRAYSTKASASTAWNLIGLGHVFSIVFLAIAAHGWQYVVMYGVAVAIAFVAGHMCLWYLRGKGESDNLSAYQGSIYVLPRLGNVFFIVALVFMAFPITPSFLAQDILLSMLHDNYVLYIALFCAAYLVMGVAVMRLYMKVFFGAHRDSHHEKAYRSS